MTKRAGGGWRTAASKVAMRAGRHFAQFTVGLPGTVDHLGFPATSMMNFGLIRPGWDVEGEDRAFAKDGHCCECCSPLM